MSRTACARSPARRARASPARRPAGRCPTSGPAPNFTGITQWLNTPGDKPLTLAGLRGKVVLIDFWTYSCINCQRSLPHVEAWASTYKKDGLVVVGVHTPEFPFEHVVSNVKAAAAQLGVTYPIAIDDKYATWNAYDNNSWPSEYLIDQQGDVRATNPYEGNYAQTENDIRELLSANPKVHLPPPTEVANRTPTQDQTPETYIGYERLNPAYYVGSPISADISDLYLPAAKVPENDLTWGGYWTEHQWSATAGKNALDGAHLPGQRRLPGAGREGHRRRVHQRRPPEDARRDRHPEPLHARVRHQIPRRAPSSSPSPPASPPTTSPSGDATEPARGRFRAS